MDDRIPGSVSTSGEFILFATLMVIGILAGMSSLRDALLSELSDVAGAVQDVNQSYRIDGVAGPGLSASGTQFDDSLDYCDSIGDVPNYFDNCISILNFVVEQEGLPN